MSKQHEEQLRQPQSSAPATEGAAPTLDELLEKARHHVMTDEEEKQAQRESWVRGEWALGEYERGMTTSFPPKRLPPKCPVTPQAAAAICGEYVQHLIAGASWPLRST